MGNCLQGSETEDVDLLQSDNDTLNASARSSITSATTAASRGRSASAGGQNARTSNRSSLGQGENNDQLRHRHSEAQRAHSSSNFPPPSYEEASMQRSTAEMTAASPLPSSIPVYHPTPGVSRQVSELTEEEQIKIAQRIGLIQHLPIDIFVEGNKTDKECIICMAEFMDGDQIRFLPCMHTYHVECIDEWLMRSLACPSCLEPVDSALLTSYHQQQLNIFTDDSAGHGGRSLPKQLDQLTSVSSPSVASIRDGKAGL